MFGSLGEKQKNVVEFLKFVINQKLAEKRTKFLYRSVKRHTKLKFKVIMVPNVE